MDSFPRTAMNSESPAKVGQAMKSVSNTALWNFRSERDMTSGTAQWSEDEDMVSTLSSESLDDESARISYIINFRLPTISPFAVHHCAHVILLRAQRATGTNPAGALMLVAKSKQVGQMAESVLKLLSKMPKLCIADGENIPKQLHRLVIDRIYEELLSKTGTPFDLMEAFNAGDKRVEHAFTLSFLKAIEDEDLESCMFYPPDSDSLCDESESDRTDPDSVENSTSMAILLLLKLLANGPPHTLPPDVSPHEFMNRVLTLYTEALNGSGVNQIEELYQNVFVDLPGQVSVERLFHKAYVSDDWGFDDDISTPLTKELLKNSDSGLTNVTPLTTETDAGVFTKPKKKTWLSRFSILKIFRKKSKTGNKAVSNIRDQDTVKPNASESPSRKLKNPQKRRSDTFTIKKFISPR